MKSNIESALVSISTDGAVLHPEDSTCSAEIVEDTPPCDMDIEQQFEPLFVDTHEYRQDERHGTPGLVTDDKGQVRYHQMKRHALAYTIQVLL